MLPNVSILGKLAILSVLMIAAFILQFYFSKSGLSRLSETIDDYQNVQVAMATSSSNLSTSVYDMQINLY
ncbi:MAG: hypothetical protein CVV51_13825, partial [Spirochaetae bacterium HGW-Spirochaetae-7]